jgi:hypothetical protein
MSKKRRIPDGFRERTLSERKSEGGRATRGAAGSVVMPPGV